MPKEHELKSRVFVRVSGGLGNQLFQFAFAYAALRRTAGREVTMEISDYERNLGHEGFCLTGLLCLAEQGGVERLRFGRMKFPTRFLLRFPHGVKVRLASLLKIRILKESKPYVHQAIPLGAGSSLFEGYWQSPKYFRGRESELASLLSRWLDVESGGLSLRMRLGLTESQGQLVMIHVRRGDYVSKRGYDTLGDEYYSPAVEFITSKVPNPIFLVFSDEMERARSEVSFPEGTLYFDDYGLSSVEVLSMMRSCDHYITGNSSLSWWAAFLGSLSKKDATVVTPRIWFKDRGETPDLFPETWKKVECRTGA